MDAEIQIYGLAAPSKEKQEQCWLLCTYTREPPVIIPSPVSVVVGNGVLLLLRVVVIATPATLAPSRTEQQQHQPTDRPTTRSPPEGAFVSAASMNTTQQLARHGPERERPT